ncbi:MAG: c-type cytochrome [Kofleriaceae bacterium]|nr:c-type cytochrome [Myxococcales bacterium]MCB9561213.1 c-type cytochrome [Kofleriaceae bacterium]
MTRITISIACVAALLGAAACKKDEAAPPAPAPSNAPATQVVKPAVAGPDQAQVAAMFKALPARFDSDANPITDDKVALGQMLYHDARLSKNQDVSCNTCHQLDKFGVDNKPVSTGHKGQNGARNSPTVYNAAGHFLQFWDGRAADVEAQAKGPVLNPVEMAMPDEAAVVAVLKSIPGYAEPFAKAFPGEKDPVTFDNMAKAIGAFERLLVTPGPFDRYLAGDQGALSDDAKRGLAAFMSTGCTACHSGPLLGGTMMMKTGVMSPYPDTKDQGRFEVTKTEADRFMFKVPSLRNVAKTGPYFHDGAVDDLHQAVKTMAKIQLGRDLTDAEAASMVAFLDSLTGEPPAALVAAPALPPSGPKTPEPDPT